MSEVNGALAAGPERVNQSPYAEGWMIKLTDVDESGATLMDEAAYLAQSEA